MVTMSSTTFRRIFFPNIVKHYRINFFSRKQVGYIMVTISSLTYSRIFFPNIGTHFRINFFQNMEVQCRMLSWNRITIHHEKDCSSTQICNHYSYFFLLKFRSRIFDCSNAMIKSFLAKYLDKQYFFTQHICLKQLWLQVNHHACFHLHGLRWPVRNGERAKNSKWKSIFSAGFEPTLRQSTTGKSAL